MTVTPNLALPIPAANGVLEEDVVKLREALLTIDQIIPGLVSQIESKQPTGDYVESDDERLDDARDPRSHTHGISEIDTLEQLLAAKQSTLVSGESIKTIDGESILGEGNLATLPAGCVAHFAMSSAPAGWLKANGATVSRSAYASLFAAIGTTFGAGDGSTTFTLPDLRGEFIRGWDDGRGADSGRGFGSAQAAANQSHTHSAGTLTAASAGAHTHAYVTGGVDNNTGNEICRASGNLEKLQGINSAGAHTHSLSGSTDSQGAEARPRNVALLACIKF